MRAMAAEMKGMMQQQVQRAAERESRMMKQMQKMQQAALRISREADEEMAKQSRRTAGKCRRDGVTAAEMRPTGD